MRQAHSSPRRERKRGARRHFPAQTSSEPPSPAITRIESMAFFGCDALTDLYFEGSCAEWGAIEKAVGWNIGFAPGLTIHCTDGDLSLDGE